MILIVVWPLAITSWSFGVHLLVVLSRWEGIVNAVALLTPFGFTTPWIDGLGVSTALFVGAIVAVVWLIRRIHRRFAVA